MSTPELPRFLSVAETAEALRMSHMGVYRAIRKNQFPAIRIGGRLVVPADALISMATTAVETSTTVNAADWATTA